MSPLPCFLPLQGKATKFSHLWTPHFHSRKHILALLCETAPGSCVGWGNGLDCCLAAPSTSSQSIIETLIQSSLFLLLMSPEMHSPAKSFLQRSQGGSQAHRMTFSKATFRWSPVLSLCRRRVISEGRQELAAGCGRGWKEAPGPRALPPSCNAEAAYRAGSQHSPCSGERGSKEHFRWKLQGKTNPLGKRRGGGQERAPWCAQAAASPGQWTGHSLPIEPLGGAAALSWFCP